MPVGAYTGPDVSTGNGVTTVFAYSFRVLTATDLVVEVNGVQKVLNVDYTVSGVGDANGGNVTFTTAPANGTQVVRHRVRPYTRAIDYQRNGSFDEETVDQDFDGLQMQVQQFEALAKRAPKAPTSVSADQVVTQDEWDDRAGRVWGFDALGKLVLLVAQAGTSLVDLAANAGASLIGFIQSGLNAVKTTVEDELRETVRLEQFDGGPGGVIDNITAFNRIKAKWGGASKGGTIELGIGEYYFSTTPKVDMQMRIVGKGGGIDTGKAASTILVPVDTDGIEFQHALVSAGGTDGSWSYIEDVQLKAQGKNASGVGMKVRAHGVGWRNISITGFKGKGLTIDSAGTNCNLCHCEGKTRITGCDGDGFFTDGGDSNAGSFVGIDASGNGGWGIYDSSFLGNTYIACHTDANTGGAYKTDNNNADNVLLGCYSESGQPASDLVYKTIVLGGAHGAGFTSGSTALVLTGGINTGRLTRAALEYVNEKGAVDITATMGQNDTSQTAFMWGSSDDTSGAQAHRLVYKNATGEWELKHANIDSRIMMALPGSKASPRSWGPRFHRGIFLGTHHPLQGGTDNIRHSSDAGNGVPTSAAVFASYKRGDVVWKTEPSAGATPGWVCVTSGTFSTFSDTTGDTDGSTGVITGMTSTTGLEVGDFVSVSLGFASTGPFQVLAKTASSITVNANSNSVQSNVTVDTPDPVFKAMAALAA